MNGSGHIPIPAKVIYMVAGSLLSGLVAIGAYMVQWNADYISDTRQAEIRLQRLETLTAPGILTRADERLRAVERRVDRIERKIE